MEISQDECRRWVERATTQAANAVALFDEAKRLQKENAALRAEVERLREARRWIPVGERLPGSGRHLVTDGSIRWTAFWYDDCWTHNEPTHRRQPTHWMPLPAPPTEEE